MLLSGHTFHRLCSGSLRQAFWVALLLPGLAGCLAGDAGAQTRGDEQTGFAGSDWSYYRGDLAGTGYSTLAAITPTNVAQLEQAWAYSLLPTDPDSRGPNSQATPIVIDGVMFVPAAGRVVALDAQTGEEIWVYPLSEGTPSRRGVAHWPGRTDEPARIIFTAGSRLVALFAETGQPVTGFGDGGIVDLGAPYNSVPLVFRDRIIVGANTPPGQQGGIGNPRAFDVLGGELAWEFNSVAQPGNAHNASWAGESWRGRLGANAWPFYFTADPETGALYVPLASPIPFAYGGDRAGSNLYSNSVVALDAVTGRYLWHFQTIHHDIWDHDPPAPPTLFDIPVANDTVPALALTTKSGYYFLLNRLTGEPLYGVTERPVAQSGVPGEQTAATQPFPDSMPAIARNQFVNADLVNAADTSESHAGQCRDLLAAQGDVVNLGPYTPWVERNPAGPARATLLFPGLAGGPNWGGVAYDNGSGLSYVFAANLGTFGWLEPNTDSSGLPYRLATPRPSAFAVAVEGQLWPCQKPPWGVLTAVDTRSGVIKWQRAMGVTEGLPAAKRDTGRPGRAGAIVTGSGLLFIASTDDNYFRALSAETGQTLWEVMLPARGNANPMTYVANDGNQYVVVAATDSLVSFSLPP